MSETPTYADVQARAKELGIADVVGKKRAFLEAAIEAELKRRADEAAASTAGDASSSGAGTGGEGTPADDPAASGAGEAGSPPAAVPTAVDVAERPAHEITATKIGGVEAWVCTCGFRTMADEETANTHAARA